MTRTRLVAHGFGFMAGLLLTWAAVGWLTGGAPVAAERFGLPLQSVDAAAFAALAGIFKGLLDLIPVPLGLWFALRRQWSALAATMVVALVFIPMVDLAAALMTGGAIAIHIPFAIALLGGAILYGRLAAIGDSAAGP